MSPPTEGTRIGKPANRSLSLVVGATLALAACSGAESAPEASSTPVEETAPVPSSAADSNAPPPGTGFIMISELSQLQMTETTFAEESDCTSMVSARADGEEYAGCVEFPPTAICLQVAEGLRESDKWWECFVRPEGCEEAIAGHEVVREVGGYVREILQTCSETEMATVLASL